MQQPLTRKKHKKSRSNSKNKPSSLKPKGGHCDMRNLRIISSSLERGGSAEGGDGVCKLITYKIPEYFSVMNYNIASRRLKTRRGVLKMRRGVLKIRRGGPNGAMRPKKSRCDKSALCIGDNFVY